MKAKNIPGILFTIVLVVIGLQLLAQAVEPYLHWIGLTLALAVILLILLGIGGLVIVLIRRFYGGDGGTFNG